ncbi:NUDIX hydrolase [Streptomyces sp. NPDC088354]|uniref:NUDIX hydrolase n=1 Tax=unclassified Streptomyces TaxID=2593676 RepID=UPI0029B864C7|nr:NUDIX hydrolase [Streptomyces sp. MI02-7b]MDX3071845.1 NUDIX hydrolase [Streptomyces sp. MI02-7b]
MDHEATRTGTRTAYRDAQGGRWCEVHLDSYRAASGAEMEVHRVRVGGGRTGVVVLALRGQDVLMVRQWRPAVGRWAWELPRGFGETDPAADALRELAEETGLVGTSATVLARMDVDSGMLENEVAVVEVAVPADAVLVPGAAGDGEVEGARWWSRAEIAAAVRAGELRDGFTLAALGALGTARPAWHWHSA